MTSLHTSWLPSEGNARGTLIAIPGLIESADAMFPTLHYWASRGFDVLGIDPRGHSASPRWSDELLADHAGDVIVEDIQRTLEDSPLARERPLILFGHSAGGAAAAAVAARLTDRVRAVILEDPFWRLPVTQFQDPTVAERATVELQLVRDMKPSCRIQEIRAIFPQWAEDELEAWARTKDDMDISLVANGHVIPSRSWTSIVSDLVRAAIPVQVLTGTIRVGMTANHRAILRALGAEVTVVHGASHFVRRDARDLFHELTDAFLDRHVPAKRQIGAVKQTAASKYSINLQIRT